MEAVVTDENCALALAAVKRNQGAAGIDRMRTTELESHLQAHWEKIRAKLLAGTYVPSPVRRVEIPKPKGTCGYWESRRYRIGAFSRCFCKY